MSEQKSTKIAAETLLPDFENHPGLAIAKPVAYWLGLTTDCPANQIDCAGLHFPKVQEMIVPNPQDPGKKVRVPVIGGLDANVTEDKILRLQEVLPRLVIRFLSEPAQKEQPGTGQNTGDPVVRARKGYVITIPTEQMVEDARANGKTLKPYIRLPNDEPAANYMYLQVCPDQKLPARGTIAPSTIGEIGIEWPNEIQSVDDLLG